MAKILCMQLVFPELELHTHHTHTHTNYDCLCVRVCACSGKRVVVVRKTRKSKPGIGSVCQMHERKSERERKTGERFFKTSLCCCQSICSFHLVSRT